MPTLATLATGLGFCEGPVALPDGSIAVSSISLGCVHLVRPDGGVDRIDTGGGANGLAADPEGNVYVAQNGGAWHGSGAAPGGVQVIRDGRAEYLAEIDGIPNDLAFGPDGRLWVTDPVREFSWHDAQDGPPGRVHAVDPATGEVETMLDEGPVFPNGLAFTPDGSELLLTATSSSQIFRYTVTASGLTDRRLLTTIDDGHPDGCSLTDRGLWVATTSGHRIDLVGLDGTLLESIDTGERSLPTNLCPDHHGTGLYVTASLRGALVHVTF